MQQENVQTATPALSGEMRMENLNKLLTKVEKLGYKDTQDQIIANFEAGVQEFEAFTVKPMGPETRMEASLHFGPGKKNDGIIYLNEIEALVVRPVPVHHLIVNGKATEGLEDPLRMLPKHDNGQLNSAVFTDVDRALLERAQNNLQYLQEHAPDLFNQLAAKYNPPLNFTVTPEQKQLQEQLQQQTVIYNRVSSYYNLTALEMYNAMDGGYPLKTLFKTKEHGPLDEQGSDNKRQFQTYLKMDFANRNQDGSTPIIFIPASHLKLGAALLDYNIEEMKSRFNRGDIIKYLEKGSKVELTNANKTGEKRIILRSNPEERELTLYTTAMQEIKNKKDYLRAPMTMNLDGDVIRVSTDRQQYQQSTPRPVLTPSENFSENFVKQREQALGASKPITTPEEKIIVSPPAISTVGQEPPDPLKQSSSDGKPNHTGTTPTDSATHLTVTPPTSRGQDPSPPLHDKGGKLDTLIPSNTKLQTGKGDNLKLSPKGRKSERVLLADKGNGKKFKR